MRAHWDIVAAVSEMVTAVATGALAVTGIWALRFAKKQLKQDRDAARIENLERQMEAFDSERFLKIRKKLATLRIRTGEFVPLLDDDAPSELYDILNFFEHLGFLVREKHLPAYQVWHAFGYWAFSLFYDARRVIEYEQADDPTTFDDFVWLIKRLQRIEVRNCGHASVPSDGDIYAFYVEENEGRAYTPRKTRRKLKQSVSGKVDSEVTAPKSATADNEQKTSEQDAKKDAVIASSQRDGTGNGL